MFLRSRQFNSYICRSVLICPYEIIETFYYLCRERLYSVMMWNEQEEVGRKMVGVFLCRV